MFDYKPADLYKNGMKRSYFSELDRNDYVVLFNGEPVNPEVAWFYSFLQNQPSTDGSAGIFKQIDDHGFIVLAGGSAVQSKLFKEQGGEKFFAVPTNVPGACEIPVHVNCLTGYRLLDDGTVEHDIATNPCMVLKFGKLEIIERSTESK